jgi:TolB protein
MTFRTLARPVSKLLLAALAAGCGRSHPPDPATAPARADAIASPSAVPATAPATAPAQQDPREAAILPDVVQLTHGFDKAGEAYFSRDMKWIIFQASPHGDQHYQMYVAPLQWKDGHISGAGQPTRISPPHSRNTCGYFSPDGHSLIFASTAGKENPDEKEGGYQREGRDYRWAFPAGMEIYRADNWQQDVEAAGGKDINLAQHPLTDNNVYDAEGSYSRDGNWIVFTSLRTTDGDIYVMRPDGSHVVQITSAPGYDGGPFFSPDGKHLVYRSDRNKNNLLQVFVADLTFDDNGMITGISAEHQVTNDGNVNWGPSWHPDGEHLIYATSKHGHANYELYATRTDGSHAVRVTYSPGADILPIFSPDGKWMMWTSKRSPDGTTQIFVSPFVAPAEW